MVSKLWSNHLVKYYAVAGKDVHQDCHNKGGILNHYVRILSKEKEAAKFYIQNYFIHEGKCLWTQRNI